MKTIIMAILAMALLGGCAWGIGKGVHDVQTIDATLSQAVSSCEAPGRPVGSPMSIECRAGLAAGSTLSTNASTDVKLAAIDMEANIVKDNPAYKCCRVVGDWVSFVVNGGADVIERGFSKAIALGVLKP